MCEGFEEVGEDQNVEFVCLSLKGTRLRVQPEWTSQSRRRLQCHHYFHNWNSFFPFKGKMILSVFSLIMSFALLITQSCGTVSSVALNQYLNERSRCNDLKLK